MEEPDPDATHECDVDAPDALPIPWLASKVHEFCSPFSFKLETERDDEIKPALAKKIAEELQAVDAYARALRATGVMPTEPP